MIKEKITKKDIIDKFVELLGIKWTPEEKQVEALSQLVAYSKTKGKNKTKDYKMTFIEAVNNKLDLNCWEHVLILSKRKPNKKHSEIVSQIKNIRPVVKMVRGRNILGHDAPYPSDIPEIIIQHMEKEDVVLDHFLGSGTTSIVANKYGVGSIGIEKNDNYYELCKKRIKDGLQV